MKYILLFIVINISLVYAQWDQPIGYTPFMKLRLYANNSNPSADSINANFIAIDRIVDELSINIDNKDFEIKNDTLKLKKQFFTYFPIKTGFNIERYILNESNKLNQYQNKILYSTRIYDNIETAKQINLYGVFGYKVITNLSYANMKLYIQIGNTIYSSDLIELEGINDFNYINIEITNININGLNNSNNILFYVSLYSVNFITVDFYLGNFQFKIWY